MNVEANLSQITSKLVAGCGVSVKTIFDRLKWKGKVKKLEKLVPYEFIHLIKWSTPTNTHCVLRGNVELFLDCDEKWIPNDNRKRLSHWLNSGEQEQNPDPSDYSLRKRYSWLFSGPPPCSFRWQLFRNLSNFSQRKNSIIMMWIQLSKNCRSAYKIMIFTLMEQTLNCIISFYFTLPI